MKSPKTIVPRLACLVVLLLASCTYPTYVTEVTTTEPKPAPKKVTPKPRPVETAEGFRAVEKPTTYSTN